ncbi:MAG TPA: helix-turn-helix domain-containing protein [Chondromyces sp.]|nr:helix-turn-helix domain-containing protein [Chondromyces sp.]
MFQVVSHLAYREAKYHPVTREEAVHRWLKVFLQSLNLPRQELSQQLYKEVHQLLRQQKVEDPLFFILRLSGKNMIGKTASQCANMLRVEETEYWFRFLHLLHYIVGTVATDSEQYPLLYAVIKDVYHHMTLTRSTKRTAELLAAGYPMEEVAEMRNLKVSTIEDHIVEIALNNPDFPIDNFIGQEDVEQVIKNAVKLTHKKLKPIKEVLPHLTYFQIRLALAKHGDSI